MQLEQLEKTFIHLYDVKDQLKQHVYARSMEAFAAGDRARDALQSPEQLAERVSRLREALIRSFGGLPANDTPLRPEVTGVVKGDGFAIENVIFQSRPDTYVTANLYVPAGIGKPRGAVLFLCGHHDTAKQTDEYQTVCQHLAKAGLVVLAVDPIGQGERLSYYEPALGETTVGCSVFEHDHAGAQSWLIGDSLARYFVHDAMRAVDYLQSRPEVDPARIGVTGNSGGGTQTALMMVCDPRIAAAAPGTFIMNRRSYLWSGQPQDAEQIWPGMTALGFDHEDLLLAMVPRPVLVLAASYDFFPIEGTRSTVARTRRFWEMYGRGDSLAFHEEDEIHKYSVPMAKAAAAFFAKHLLEGQASAVGGKTGPVPHAALQCTRSGQVRGDYAHARAAYEENLERLNEIQATRGVASERRAEKAALGWLSAQVFAFRERVALNPRLAVLGHWEELIVRNAVWWSQEDILGHGLLFRHTAHEERKLPLTIAVWDNGTRRLQPHGDWISASCAAGRAVLVLDVTGAGALTPNDINSAGVRDVLGTLYKLTTDLMWLGDSLAAIRTFDVLRALDLAEILPGIDGAQPATIYTSGRYGLYARLASAIDDRAVRLEAAESFDSITAWVTDRHYDKHDFAGLILPGVLKHFDLPDMK